MSSKLHVPNLERVTGSIILTGSRDTSERDFPSLTYVGGDMHLAGTGFERLPPKLNRVEGNVYLSPDMPKTMIDDCVAKKASGVVRGHVYLIGGRVVHGKDGEVTYEEIMQLT